MKMNKIKLAWLLALGIVSSASASNIIYMTGSTAFRGQVYNACSQATNTGGVFDTTPTVTGYANSTKSKSQYVMFHGNIGGVDTVINAFWTGSEAGIASVAGVSATVANGLNDGGVLAGAQTTFLNPADSGNLAGNSGTANLPTGGQLEATPRQADLCFSDTSQAVSLTKRVSPNVLTSYGIVGIVPFVWYKGAVNKNDAVWARLTNISSYQANELLQTGAKTADFFTSGSLGATNDYDHTVYLIGRNKGSGTRVNTLIAAGYPIGQTIVQYQANSTIGVNPFNGLNGLYFDVTKSGYTLTNMAAAGSAPAGSDNGYESGGDVKAALDGKSASTTTSPATQASIPPTGGYSADGGNTFALTVGYLGLSDAGVPASGAMSTSVLTYNGVVESDGAVESGTYNYWGHEYVYGKPTPDNPAATALVPKLFTAIKTQLCNNDASGTAGYNAATQFGPGFNVAADPANLHSGGIYGFYMYADRGTAPSDTGYPVGGNAIGLYTSKLTAAQ